MSAAGGLAGFEILARSWNAQAPLGWDAHDPTPVAGAVCFMLSDWSLGVTGEILRVDGGFRAVGTSVEVLIGSFQEASNPT